jgi:hypothetical protein
MTKPQAELLKSMNEVLAQEFDFGTIGKKARYTNYEAGKLISLNCEIFYGIIDDGQCTVRQYNKLTEIAGRTPKQPRHMISFYEANKWIEKYSKNN